MRDFHSQFATAIFLLILVVVVPNTHWGSQSESENAGPTNETFTTAASALGSIRGMPVVVGDGEEKTGIELALDTCSSISGAVTDFASGAGIMDVQVSIYDDTWSSIASVWTDENGDYISVACFPAGTYFARTYDDSGGHYLDELYDDIPCPLGCDVTTGTPITVGDGEAVTGIDFALVVGGHISGNVTDASTTGGIDGVLVRIWDLSGRRAEGVYTDANGYYSASVGLPTGTYFAGTWDPTGHYLNVMYDDFPCAFGCSIGVSTPIVVTNGASVTGVDFSLETGGSISGTVIETSTLSGIQNMRVKIYALAGNYVTEGTTDENGNYTSFLGLPAGTYFALTANSSAGLYFNKLYNDIFCHDSCIASSGWPINVGAGEAVTGIDFALDAPGSISGTITDADSGVGIEGVNARIYASSGTPVAGGGTDEDGNYRISDLMWLLPGTYFVVAEDYAKYGAQLFDGIPCTSGCDVTLGAPVTVGSGQTTTGINFTMSSSIFADGFEMGGTSVWSHTIGGP